MLKTLMIRSALLAFAFAMSVAAHAYAADPKRIDVPAGDLATALQALARQSGVELVYQSDQLKGLRTKGVTGEFTPEDAVTKLLEGTPLTFRKDPSGAMLIAPPKTPLSSLEESEGPTLSEGKRSRGGAAERVAQANDPDSGTEGGVARGGVRDPQSSMTDEESSYENQELPAPEGRGKAIPEILVKGSRILNMDISRSRDDAQPYVIFERERIEQSGAKNIEEFLKQRLTMNAQSFTPAQSGANIGNLGNMSQINLRGLGTNQTLLLVDGHRLSSAFSLQGPQQPDLNGIPMAAVERIEILPSTASGIYGGSATGGVINVVLRRDYNGVESKITYENTFDTDAAIRKIDVSAGFNLEGGITNVLLAGSWSDSADLLVADRDFVQRGRATAARNNPNYFASAPPLGATTNIRSVNGSPLFGPGTPNFTSVPVGYAGGGGLAPLQANAGIYNLDLANTRQFTSTGNPGGPGGLLGLSNSPTVESLTATLRRQFAPGVQAFLELAASNNNGATSAVGSGSAATNGYTISATAPNNPFNQAILVNVPTNFINDPDGFRSTTYERRAVGGVIVKLPYDWQGEVDYLWHRTRFYFESGFLRTGGDVAAIANGTLDVLRDTDAFPLDFTPYFLTTRTHVQPTHSTSKDATLRLAGPVGMLPGGAPILSGSFERRDEEFGDYMGRQGPSTACPDPCFQVLRSRSQSINSAYLEAKLPLVSARNAVPGIRDLELQLAGRWDDYNIVGTNGGFVATLNAIPNTPLVRVTNDTRATSPTLGLRYQPVDDVILRASFGKGFLPPSVVQLTPAAPLNGTGSTDPRRGNEPLAPWQAITGGNPALGPERSKSWSAGVVLTPRFLPDLRLSVDWTKIEKTDNFANPASALGATQALINREDLFPGRIIRGPAPGGTDPFPTVGRITAIDTTLINLTQAQVEAYDVQLDYRWDSASLGTFDLFAVATWQPHFKTQVLSSLPIVENVGVGGVNPLKFKANAGLTWNYQGWTLGWTARYFDSYLVANPAVPSNADRILAQGNDGRVASQAYHDLYTSYRFGQSGGGSMLDSTLFANAEVSLGIKNVFNRTPPFDTGTLYFVSNYGDTRLASYYLTLKLSY